MKRENVNKLCEVDCTSCWFKEYAVQCVLLQSGGLVQGVWHQAVWM